MSQQKLDLIKPFGPYIAKIKIPDDIVEKLNNYVDKIILDEEKSTKQNAGQRLVGNVTQEFQIDNEFSSSCGWNKLLHQATSKFIEVTLEKKITSPKKFLPEDFFLFIGRMTPFANVDLLIKNNKNETLLTWRKKGDRKSVV